MGYPLTIVSYNGKQLMSKQIEQYFEFNGIRQLKVLVYSPQTNGQLERFIQNLKNCIKQAFDNEDSIKKVFGGI